MLFHLLTMCVPAIRCLGHVFQLFHDVIHGAVGLGVPDNVSKDGNQRFPRGCYVDRFGSFIHIP